MSVQYTLMLTAEQAEGSCDYAGSIEGITGRQEPFLEALVASAKGAGSGPAVMSLVRAVRVASSRLSSDSKVALAEASNGSGSGGDLRLPWAPSGLDGFNRGAHYGSGVSAAGSSGEASAVLVLQRVSAAEITRADVAVLTAALQSQVASAAKKAEPTAAPLSLSVESVEARDPGAMYGGATVSLTMKSHAGGPGAAAGILSPLGGDDQAAAPAVALTADEMKTALQDAVDDGSLLAALKAGKPRKGSRLPRTAVFRNALLCVVSPVSSCE
jgi:hypothetical protein